MNTDEISLADFDAEKIKDINRDILLTTNSLNTITKCCTEAQKYNLMIGITGEPGFGKSAAFNHYNLNNENVYHLTVEKSMSSKEVYSNLNTLLGINIIDLTNISLNAIIKTIAYTLNSSGENNLLIFDEAGKFTANKLLFLHELRDATKKTTGIIVAGPPYFKKNIEKWKQEQIEGIPEVFRRIQLWVEIDPPTKKEKEILCREKGIINDFLIKSIAKECYSFGDLENKILEARLFFLTESELAAVKDSNS